MWITTGSHRRFLPMFSDSGLAEHIAQEYALLEALDAQLRAERDGLLAGDPAAINQAVRAKTPLLAALMQSAEKWPVPHDSALPASGEALRDLARAVWQRNTENNVLAEVFMQQVQAQLDCLRGVENTPHYGPIRALPQGRALGSA